MNYLIDSPSFWQFPRSILNQLIKSDIKKNCWRLNIVNMNRLEVMEGYKTLWFSKLMPNNLSKIANGKFFIYIIRSIRDHYHPRMKVVWRSWPDETSGSSRRPAEPLDYHAGEAKTTEPSRWPREPSGPLRRPSYTSRPVHGLDKTSEKKRSPVKLLNT